MGINNHWRNKQLGKNLLRQEQLCLDFVSAHQQLTWYWLGTKDYFYDHCKSVISTGVPWQGLILINHLSSLSPKNLVAEVDRVMTNDINAAYIAINRFEILPINDLDLDYPDCLGKSIDLIMHCCKKKFRRYHHPQHVDGRHFVGVHGLDIFVYECNH